MLQRYFSAHYVLWMFKRAQNITSSLQPSTILLTIASSRLGHKLTEPQIFLITVSKYSDSIDISGRAIAQAVCRWLPTEAARVRAQVWSIGICGGQSGAGAAFLRVLRLPLPVFIPPNSPSSQLPGESTIGQKWPTCRLDPIWTSPPTMRIKKSRYLKKKNTNIDAIRYALNLISVQHFYSL
jgi:hypothetical protein